MEKPPESPFDVRDALDDVHDLQAVGVDAETLRTMYPQLADIIRDETPDERARNASVVARLRASLT
jgi:hypothetical protein